MLNGFFRIRELAVYGRTGPMGMTEQAFYIPHLRTRLPDGNAKLQEDELKDREYDNERRIEQEMMIDGSPMMNFADGDLGGGDLGNIDGTIESAFEKEMATYKSNADRQLLQTIFDSSPDENSVELDGRNDMENIIPQSVKDNQEVEQRNDIIIDNETAAGSETNQILLEEPEKSVEMNSDDDTSQTRKEEIIQSIAKPMATGDWSKYQTKKKDKPRPEDNPILRDWKERLKNKPKVIDTETEVAKPLPPFPSDEHFVGIWKLDSTPGGKVIDEEKMLIDPNSSENLVLRVDGTVGGGPILDPENLHRAAGGTWKFFNAQWVGPTESENDEDSITTRLRIRLLIPPEKERILVFEGEVKQGIFSSPESISRDNMNELRISSFANKLSKNDQIESTSKNSSLIQCSGEMWTENARGTKSRRKVGRFTLSKIQRDSTYKYSIPAPQVSQFCSKVNFCA